MDTYAHRLICTEDSVAIDQFDRGELCVCVCAYCVCMCVCVCVCVCVCILCVCVCVCGADQVP